MRAINIYFVLIVLFPSLLMAQDLSVEGIVKDSLGNTIPFASLRLENEKEAVSTVADAVGQFKLKISAPGKYRLTAMATGYQDYSTTLTVPYEGNSFEVILEEASYFMDEVVVSATRNRVRRSEAPVIVNTIGDKLLEAAQSITVADGLNYSPGVRVENNCQNCGFTQVRLNGLDGSYSQILVNSRAIFSALNSVYGLEQIPASMIDRIEVVRSGGSALYGSNAIAGTINIITKDPVLNRWEVGGYLGLIDGETPDRTLSANASVVSEDLDAGATFYGMLRDRGAYDANGDGFTEIVKLKNNIFGTRAYFKPNELSKLSLDLTALKEYRRGGDRLDLAPHFTDIAEELQTDTYMGGLTYDIRNASGSDKVSIYSSAQYSERASYYGGLGGGRTAADSLLALRAYGNTDDLALANGVQYTHYWEKDVLTAGVEYNYNGTEDFIQGYNRLIDQRVHTVGTYAQYEWQPVKGLKALLGTRLDNVSVDGEYTLGNIAVNTDRDHAVLSPRATIMYDFTDKLKFRGGYARGFRAPQAFNEDLHISSVGGEPQFVILADDLEVEYSNAYTASLNYTDAESKFQKNFLLEGFLTDLNDPFTLVSTGAVLDNGSIVEEVRNGEGARVYGTNFELGLSPNKHWRFQLGGTYQQTEYKNPQVLFESDGSTPGESDVVVDEFVRNPDLYGFTSIAWLPEGGFSANLTGTYTGVMTVPRVVSDTGFLDLRQTDPFLDLNINLSYHFDLSEAFHITLNGGVKNFLDSFQDDFDSGPTRDSDYVYGPALPRQFFIGIKIGDLH